MSHDTPEWNSIRPGRDESSRRVRGWEEKQAVSSERPVVVQQHRMGGGLEEGWVPAPRA